MISPIVPAAKPASPAELNTRWELLVCPTGTQDAPAIVQLCGWLAEAAPGNVATATASPKQIAELFLNFDILASITTWGLVKSLFTFAFIYFSVQLGFNFRIVKFRIPMARPLLTD